MLMTKALAPALSFVQYDYEEECEMHACWTHPQRSDRCPHLDRAESAIYSVRFLIVCESKFDMAS